MKILQILDLFYSYVFALIGLCQPNMIDVGGMQEVSKNMQHYSFVPSDSNREPEPSLLPKYVGPLESTDNDSATELNNHVLSTPITAPQRGASYILNQVFQIIVNVLVFEAFLCGKWPGNDSKAV